VIAKVLKAKPESSDRQIVTITKVDHKTVGAVRDKLEATGKIPQLTKTVGSDGKARSRHKPTGGAEPTPSTSCRQQEGSEPDAEAEIEPDNRRVAFLLRADQAAQFAKYSGPVDQDVLNGARAGGWAELVTRLEGAQ